MRIENITLAAAIAISGSDQLTYFSVPPLISKPGSGYHYETGILNVEINSNQLKPGDLAPDTLGGHGELDIIQFVAFNSKNQSIHSGVVVLRINESNPNENAAMIMLAGLEGDKTVKGSHLKSGALDVHATPDGLNVSLGGDGGMQIMHDENGELTVWANGLPISYEKDGVVVTERITFEAIAPAIQDRSRIMHGQTPSSTSYSRQAIGLSAEGSLNMNYIQHTSLTELPTGLASFSELATAALTGQLDAVYPPVVSMKLNPTNFPAPGEMIIVQPDSANIGKSTAFIYKADGTTTFNVPAKLTLQNSLDPDNHTALPASITTNDITITLRSLELAAAQTRFGFTIPLPDGRNLPILLWITTTDNGEQVIANNIGQPNTKSQLPLIQN